MIELKKNKYQKDYEEIKKKCGYIKLRKKKLICDFMHGETALYICNICVVPELNF
jgi:hypothetical protein